MRNKRKIKEKGIEKTSDGSGLGAERWEWGKEEKKKKRIRIQWVRRIRSIKRWTEEDAGDRDVSKYAKIECSQQWLIM